MGKGKGMLNRETAEGKSKAGSTKTDGSLQPGKTGYHRSEFGGTEDPNYRILDGHTSKDESPSRMEGTDVHAIAHHSVTGELYSGDPARHGHLGKVNQASQKKGGVENGADEPRHGGDGKPEGN